MKIKKISAILLLILASVLYLSAQVWQRSTPVTESCTSFLADVGHGHFDIHVSKSGNDTGNGSVTEPFLTIGHAVSKAVPGDKVIIHEGVYREDNHYAGRKGLTAPWTQKAAEKLRPEGEGFGADHPGFGTLLFYTDKKQPSL